MALPTISVTRGDDFTIPLEFHEPVTGDALDLTGSTIYLTVKERQDDDLADTAAVFKQTVEATAPSPLNRVEIVGVPADTKSRRAKEYFYDVQLKDTSGKIVTLGTGIFEITKEATNRG